MRKRDKKILKKLYSEEKTTSNIMNEIELNRTTTIKRLDSLEKFGLVNSNKDVMPFRWKITKDGEKILKSNGGVK